MQTPLYVLGALAGVIGSVVGAVVAVVSSPVVYAIAMSYPGGDEKPMYFPLFLVRSFLTFPLILTSGCSFSSLSL